MQTMRGGQPIEDVIWIVPEQARVGPEQAAPLPNIGLNPPTARALLNTPEGFLREGPHDLCIARLRVCAVAMS
ncbi:MAG: hypothetical protein ABJB17_09480 [Burkholderiales bacterium]